MKKSVSILLLFTMLLATVNVYAFNFLSYKNKIGNQRFLVLMYHKLSENPDEWSDFCISPQKFEEDIIFLQKQGYVFRTASEIAKKDVSQQGKTVVLTFDDGYESDYKYALEIIKKHRVKATFFVTGYYLNKEGYLTNEMLKEMSESKLVEIGNHSYYLHERSYDDIRKLHDGEDYKSVVDDFLKNKNILEVVIGKDVTSLTYPNGIYSKKVNDELIKNGINITFSTGTEKYDFNPTTPVGRRTREDKATIQDIVMELVRM